MKKNLIMGVAKSYDGDTLEPFVFSWKKNCPSADLILFVDDISDFTRDKLIRFGCLIENFPDEYKEIILVNSRWKFYVDFLEAHGNRYEQIFLADTRDVIFQWDLFDNFKLRSNYLCYVTEGTDIGKCKTNYDWIFSCFGKIEADKLSDKTVICCGTIVGTVIAMKTFCLTMWDALNGNEVWGHEQATMNYLVYNNLLPIENLIESDVYDREIFTAGAADNFSVHGDKIFRNGGVPAVVHQYDRKDELLALVDEIYHDKNFYFDERFTDTRSIIEQTTSLLRADKIGAATKIFLRKYLSDTDFSDFGGALIRLLNIALKKPLSKPLEFLELAVQSAAKSTYKYSGYFLADVCSLPKRLEEQGHPVDPEFKLHAANIILELSRQCLDEKDFGKFFYFTDKIKEFALPMNKDFYLLQAKAYQILGKKDAELESYKKALELG